MMIEYRIEIFLSNKEIDQLLNEYKFIQFGCVTFEICDFLSPPFFSLHTICEEKKTCTSV